MGRKGTGQVMPFPHLPGPQGCCAPGRIKWGRAPMGHSPVGEGGHPNPVSVTKARQKGAQRREEIPVHPGWLLGWLSPLSHHSLGLLPPPPFLLLHPPSLCDPSTAGPLHVLFVCLLTDQQVIIKHPRHRQLSGEQGRPSLGLPDQRRDTDDER